MNRKEWLFNNGDVQQVIQLRSEAAKNLVDELPEPEFSASSDEQVILHLLPDLLIEPLDVQWEGITLRQKEATLSSARFDRHGILAMQGVSSIKGVCIDVSIPFRGDSGLFHVRPSKFTLSPPSGAIRQDKSSHSGLVEATFEAPSHEQPTRIVQEKDEWIRSLKQAVEQINRDLDPLEATVREALIKAIKNRRERLSKHEEIIKAFNIPIAPKQGAPSLQPFPIRKQPRPPLASPSDKPMQYEISDEIYGHILKVIRHEGCTFETIPDTLGKLGEEDVRNIMLAHLNGHFEGAAKGEVFRAKGKTDVFIEFENRAAFVAECKNWGGAKVVQEALSQLLGYLTWRDCKAALILFNMDAVGFSGIQAKVAEILGTHPQFVRNVNGQPEGEWRVVVRNPKDSERLITVHVFLFDLYTKGAPL